MATALMKQGYSPDQAMQLAKSPDAVNLMFRDKESQRAQANSDRSFNEQRRQFDMGFNKPDVVGSGDTGYYEYRRGSGEMRPLTTPSGPKPPAGYEWAAGPNGERQMRPIAGGPAEKDHTIPAEVAGRVGLADVYLQKSPAIRKEIESGALTGPVDLTKARSGFGTGGVVHRDIESGVDALRRSLTGAGMPAAEANDYVKRYLPTYQDDANSLATKHDRLVEELTAMRGKIMQGREGKNATPLSAVSDDYYQKKMPPAEERKSPPTERDLRRTRGGVPYRVLP
jgi:hypothetical protein